MIYKNTPNTQNEDRYDITLITTLIISAPIVLIAIITPIHRFKKHKDEIEKLHQQYTDTETVILKEYLKKPTTDEQ